MTMKDQISLFAIWKDAEKDTFQLSRLNFMLCFITAVIPALSLFAYDFFYESIPLYLMGIVIIGFIISATFQGKALLDIVHNRKQNPFEYPFSLVQAFLMQAAALGLWHGIIILALQNGEHVFDLVFQLSGHHKTEKGLFLILFLALLYLLMRLQFTSLYILEQRCNIVPAMHRSWLLTKHNNWFVEKFFLWQVAAVIISIFIFVSDWNSNFLVIATAMIIVFSNPMQVRIFKELQ